MEDISNYQNWRHLRLGSSDDEDGAWGGTPNPSKTHTTGDSREQQWLRSIKARDTEIKTLRDRLAAIESQMAQKSASSNYLNQQVPSNPFQQESKLQYDSETFQYNNERQRCGTKPRSQSMWNLTTNVFDRQQAPLLRPPRLNNRRSQSVVDLSDDEEAQDVVRTEHVRRYQVETLPNFDGRNPDEWLRFESIYLHMRDIGFTNYELTASLNKALKGDALAMVEDLLSTRAKPKKIMKELRDFYGDYRLTVNRLKDEVIAADPPRNMPKYQLLQFALKVKRLVTHLLHFNRSTDLDDTYLQEKIVLKLRDEHQDQWSQMIRRYPDANLQDLSNFLMDRSKDLSARHPQKRETIKQKPTIVRRINVHDVEAIESENDENLKSCDEDEDLISCGVVKNSVKSNKSSHDDAGCFQCTGKHRLLECPKFLALPVPKRYGVIKTKGICSVCLRSTRHSWQDCQFKAPCQVEGCRLFHHIFLHDFTKLAEPLEADDKTNNQNANVAEINVHTGGSVRMYGVVPVEVKAGNGNFVRTYAMLDLGSGVTLIDKQLFQELQLTGTQSPLRLRWTDESEINEHDSIRLNLDLRGVTRSKTYTLNDVHTVNKLNLPQQTQIASELKRKFKYLQPIALPSFEAAVPKILIGVTHSKLCIGREVSSKDIHYPVAIKSPLGWALFGSNNLIEPATVNTHCDLQETAKNGQVNFDEMTHELVKQQMMLDSFGVQLVKGATKSDEEKQVAKIIERTLKYVGDRYEIGLFWKHDNINLPNNEYMARQRLKCTEKSLSRDPERLQWVNNRFQTMIDLGYIRKATEDELLKKWKRTWYLPLFVIINENKRPPKPRIVYDAAAAVGGVSLNSFLHAGPDLIPPLVGALFRFREKQFAVQGDVRDMFHQVKIIEDDQQCQRVLWRWGDSSTKPDVYILQVMAFGPRCSPAAAQIVKNEHAKIYTTTKPEAANAVTNTYVDDYLSSHSTIQRAAAVTSDAIHIMKEAGFDLINFQSNSLQLLKLLPPSNVAKGPISVDPMNDLTYTTKILGLFWNPANDKFQFKVDERIVPTFLKDFQRLPTKREFLRLIMKVFDPLGILLPFTIRAKCILQEVWRAGIGWDETIPSNLESCLHGWVNQLTQVVPTIHVKRWYSDINDDNVQLHVFTDASESAMGAVAYFRYDNGHEVKVVHVMAKARVMPLKTMSIPQAELVAAVIGVRLAQTIKELHSVNVQSTHYWCDSKCVLAQLNSGKKMKQFVMVRVGEILENSSCRQWNYVASKENPADYITRPMNEVLATEKGWLNGPSFLYAPKDQWPEPFVLHEDDSVLLGTLITEFEAPPEFVLLKDIRATYGANWAKLRKVVAYRLRFIRLRLLRQPFPARYLTTDEYINAEKYMFAAIQSEAFPEAYSALKANRPVEDKKLLPLNPFMTDDGVIRLRSRLQLSTLSYAAKNPPILPNDHAIVRALARHVHNSMLHQGTEAMIAKLRARAWIIGARKLVKSIGKECNTCKLRRAQAVIPLMGNLPTHRVVFTQYPFDETGADCFGPYTVANGKTLIKRYGIIFVCMNTRAVHLELLADMSTSSVLQALGDFISRRGTPRNIYSDCGTNFIGANNEYHRQLALIADELGAAVAERHNITWHFNPPYTPHFGGAWEALIKCTKNAMQHLNTLLHCPQEHVMRSALVRLEGMLNSRPLTHTPVGPDSQEPLTPNHFIIGHAAMTQYPYEADSRDLVSKFGYRRVQCLAQHLFKRWQKEYLPILTRRSKWNQDTKPIEIGDLVLIFNKSKPKMTWKRGIVSALHPGPDGRTRVVTVKVGVREFIKAAVVNLARLDVESGPSAEPPERR